MPPFSIFMFIFAGVILLYAVILAVTKDYRMLPLAVQASLKKKNRKQYIVRLAGAVAVTALAPAICGVIGIWSETGGLIAFAVALVICLWIDTKLMKDMY